jgi:hypothetical protein
MTRWIKALAARFCGGECKECKAYKEAAYKYTAAFRVSAGLDPKTGKARVV